MLWLQRGKRLARLLEAGVKGLDFTSARSIQSAGTIQYDQFFGSDKSKTAKDPFTAVIVHGLLGQAKNWRTFARALAKDAECASGDPWRVITVDLRNHGDSSFVHGLHPPHDMSNSAADLVNLVQQKLDGRAPEVVCGHSLGGKVVLEYVKQTSADGSAVTRPQHTWTLDSQPCFVSAEMFPDVAKVLNAVKSVDVPVKQRNALLEEFRSKGFSEPLVQWLGSNLVPVPKSADKGFTWAFNVAGASAMYLSYRTTSYMSLLAEPPNGVTVNVLRAGASDRWCNSMIAELNAAQEKAEDRFEAGDSTGKTVLHLLEGAGHWVHTDKPGELKSMILDSLKEVRR